MSAVKRFLRIVLYGLGGLLVLLLLLTGISQTQFFRDRLRAAALANLHSLLDADIELGSLTGNLLTGFSVDSISVVSRGELFFSAGRLDLRYNLFGLPGKRVSVRSIDLTRPVIRLVRHAGSRWNFQEIVREKPEDTTAPGPFDWIVSIRHFQLEDGTIDFLDSASLADPSHGPPDTSSVEYHRFLLRHVNLEMSGRASKNELRLTLSNLAFICDQPSVTVKHIAGEFLITPEETRASEVVLTTSRSDLRLSASMKEFDLLAGTPLVRFQRNPVKLSLAANNLDLDELNRFIPELRFLHGPVGLNLNASGEFGDLKVQQLEVKYGQSDLSLRGTLSHLHDPDNLFLNVKMTESKILPSDPLKLMPALSLPDFSPIGMTTLNLEFEGRPTDFHTKFLLETGAGNVQSDMELKVGGPRFLRYKGSVTVQHLNLASVLGNQTLQSSLNGTLRIEGEGVSLQDIDAKMSAEFDSSQFRGLAVPVAHMTGDGKDKILNTTVDVALGNMKSTLTASLDARESAAPRFSVVGDVNTLNLEEILHDKAYNSDLTLRINARGKGLSWDKLGGDFLLDVGSSRYGDYQMSPGTIHLVLDQDDTLHRTLTLESNIADLSLAGSYHLEYMTRLVAYEWQSVRRAVGAKFASLDTAFRKTGDGGGREAYRKKILPRRR